MKPGKTYVDKDDLLSQGRPITEDVTTTEVNTCLQYEREVDALVRLTKSNCSCARKHINNFRLDEANPWVDQGYLGFVLMSRIQGDPCQNFAPETAKP